MKKGKLINSELSYVVSKMGHTDTIAIADSGLPIPKNVSRIDLALTEGIPSFMDTLETILEELKIEEIIVAEEMEKASPELHRKIMAKVEDLEKIENSKIIISKMSHEEFKKETENCVAIVRTGEFTPYANIILKSSVVF